MKINALFPMGVNVMGTVQIYTAQIIKGGLTVPPLGAGKLAVGSPVVWKTALTESMHVSCMHKLFYCDVMADYNRY